MRIKPPASHDGCPSCLYRVIALLALTNVVHGGLAQAQPGTLKFPPIPPKQTFINDYVNVIDAEAANEIGHLQRWAFEKFDTPVMVVTIPSMGRYVNRKHSIELFARKWFNHWEIGKRDDSGKTINRGILLLVSIGDRKARIELGAEWGRRWDRHCQVIMDQAIIPAFKQRDYSKGIREGVASMQTMIESGPDAVPPGNFADDLAAALSSKPLPFNPLPLWGILAMTLVGIGSIVVSFSLTGDSRQTLLTVGVFVLAAALFFWFVLALLWMVFGSDSDGDNTFGSGGFSGGGFGSGGFSGGGGASGSW